jgi:UDP-glucose 4-epimerase
MTLRGMRILVTGGAGFIGSHLVERLISEEGAIVRVVDDFSTGDIRNLQPFIQRIELLTGDIRDRAVVRRAMNSVDIVFHEAAQINPAKAVEDPMLDFEINVTGTLNLLFEALEQKAKGFIMASTNVYGNATCELMKEELSTLAIKNTLLSPYAAAKVAGEAYLKVLNDEFGLPTVRLRYTNVYGPRQLSKSESGVIAIFVKSALLGKPMRIFGDGSHSRDFVYIDDVVEANILAASKSEANGDVFNVGTGVEIPVKDLAIMINQITGANVAIEFDRCRAADFVRVRADLSHINERLGYSPKVIFKEGLERYIKWCQGHLDRL